MTEKNSRTMLSDRIAFSEIIDPKLKTNQIRLTFFCPLSEKTASAYALAGDIVASSNQKYPSNAEMNRQLHLLYGSDLGSDVMKVGNEQLISLRAVAIDDAYAMQKEPVFDTLLQILIDCLTHPNAENGAFNQAEFEMNQRELLDTIEADINEKRSYSVHQATAAAYDGEPAAISRFGTLETARALTPETTYSAFQDLLRTANIEIFFVGPKKRPGLADQLLHVLSAFSTEKVAPLSSLIAPSPAKLSPKTIKESLPVEQCKLVLVLKSSEQNRFANQMMSMILGGTTTSKLFAIVREKMSLCYYCSANFNIHKNTLVIDCGVESENMETAKEAILDQIAAIQKGEISEMEFSSAQLFMHNSLHGVGDTTSSYVSWYLGQICIGENATPSEEEENYFKITQDDIVAAAKALTPDTVYTLES